MRYCKIEDCTEANNNCKCCKYLNNCDFPWVYSIWSRNNKLLSPCIPGWVKPAFKENKIITITGNQDFCVFSVPKKTDYVTVNEICVDDSARGKGISKKLINTLMDTYDRDILAKCVKDTSAEAFWSHLGVKIGEEKSKQRIVCTYLVKNNHKKIQKVRLF